MRKAKSLVSGPTTTSLACVKILEMAMRAMERCSIGLLSFCTICSRLSKKCIFSMPFMTFFIADKLRIVIRMASSDTSVYGLLVLNLRILMIDFMLRSVRY